MNLIRRLSVLMISTAILTACGKDACGTGQQPEEPETPEIRAFTEGADISWSTEMEGKGMKFYNAAGQETECTAVMKEIGFDAIRLRVWVDPKDGLCGKKDVLTKAKRAKAHGMRLMIDFHYSDSWADPGKQNIPESWKSYDVTQMTAAVYDHTKDILNTLESNGIDVEWVQVGNEVNSGMLWPSGKVKGESAENFVKYTNAGYDAVKSVYPDAKVILHVSNGHDSDLFSWFFGLMKKNNAKYDMIGMSLYPSWWEDGGWTKGWKGIVDKCLSNMLSLSSKHGKPVMLCELGMPCSEPAMSKEAIRYIIDGCRKIRDCHGVFYWEPEAPDGYNGGYGMGAFKDGRPTIALDPFRGEVEEKTILNIKSE